MEAFLELGLDPKIGSAVVGLGYEEPTAIQKQAIPPLIQGRDVLGQAATGTGKTAAFALPLLQRLSAHAAEKKGAPRGLILVPTRELSMQVSEAIYSYGKEMRVQVVPIYGGQPIGRQLRRLEQGVDIVVATPGRALDLMRRGALDLGKVTTVVLDEADEMLDMGFADDLEAILESTPAEKQTALFSATLAPRIAKIAEKHLRDPVRIQTGRDVAQARPKVRQLAYVVDRAHKVASLVRILDVESPTAAIIFCRTRIDVDHLNEALLTRGYQVASLHGGMSQEQRDKVMRQFRSGSAELLVATDVAARGLDVSHLSHVINYEIPSAPEDYVHRIGRTARAGREGVAITLVEPREHRLLRVFEHATKSTIEVSRVPTVSDLRAKRFELTRVAVQEALLEGDLDRYRALVDALSTDYDIVEIALAAVKLAHGAIGGEREETEIPTVEPPRRDSGFRKDGGAPPRAGNRGGDIVRIYIGAGRNDGIRPQDLVGAIANETGLSGRMIGSIYIGDKHSTVELPDGEAERVIEVLARVGFRGKRVPVRRDRSASPPRKPKGPPPRGRKKTR